MSEKPTRIDTIRVKNNGGYICDRDDVEYLLDTIARMTEENERLADVKKLVQEYPLTAEGMTQLRSRLAGTEKELEQLRKVVGCMGRGWDYWFISDSDAKANSLDIAALKERK